MWPMLGAYAFIVGVVLAIVLGVLIPPNAWLLAGLSILGLLVALLNVTEKEVHDYLLANVTVIIGANAFNVMVTSLASPLGLGAMATTLQTITSNLVFFVAPGAVLVALKEIYQLARN